MVTSLVKDGKIILPSKSYAPTKLKYTTEQLADIQGNMAKAKALQESLGLGVPSQSGLLAAVKKAERVQLIKEILNLNPDYYVVKLPNRKELPLFAVNRSKNTAFCVDGAFRNIKDPPEVVLVKLAPGLSSIECTLSPNMRSYKASIPAIPLEGLEKAQEIRSLDSELDIYMAYLPSWEAKPQIDPVLLVECGGEFIHFYEWGGDVDLINGMLKRVD